MKYLQIGVGVYLSDISIIQEGPGIRKYQYKDEGIQFLTVTNILEDDIDLEKSEKYISLDEYNEKYSHFTINKGDIVTACSGGSWGKSAVFTSDEKLILNTSTLRLRFFNDLGDNKYLYYLTKTDHFKNSLSSYSTGQQPNYGYYHYSRIPIPLPPLPEQQRIVSILDHCFEAIDKAKANAEQNLQNAKELFESYLQGVFEKRGENWKNVNIDSVCEVVNGGTPKTKVKEYWNGDVNWITPADLGKLDSVLVNETSRKITELGLQKSSAKLFKENSVILSTRAPIGHLAINTVPMSTNQGCRGLVPNKNLNTWFLYYFLKGNIQLLNDLGTGATFLELSSKALKSVIIPLPPLKDQIRLVSILNKYVEASQNLETHYQKRIDDLEELKKSILQKAFAGELKTEKMVEEMEEVEL